MLWRTYTAHNEHGGDDQAVETDDGQDGNPDKQTVGFFIYCSSSHFPRAIALVLWRKQAGHM